jgi:hypothetical protein
MDNSYRMLKVGSQDIKRVIIEYFSENHSSLSSNILDHVVRSEKDKGIRHTQPDLFRVYIHELLWDLVTKRALTPINETGGETRFYVTDSNKLSF